MEEAVRVLARSDELISRATSTDPHGNRPPVYKAIGISLAIASGLFIGTSFVLKKTGLLKANVKYNEEAGEGYGYLKNAYWWTGMTLMIIGEICNFVAYAFVDAILVTPLGALSVVITTILSAIFLKERLSFVGKVGCFQCIVGSVVIVMNAPAQSSAATIQDMKHFVIAPGFLTYAGVVIVGSAFIALWAGPRYGKKSMLVYLTVCSLIGGLSVVATQGLGAAVVTQIAGTPQFNQWFLYVLLVFVIATLVTEIIFLNVRSAEARGQCFEANRELESAQSFQCRLGNTHLLRLLHKFDHSHLRHPLSRLQRHTYFYRYSRAWILCNLLGGCLAPTIKICERCARHCSVQGRPGSGSDRCRAGGARVGAKGRCHSRSSCIGPTNFSGEAEERGRRSETGA